MRVRLGRVAHVRSDDKGDTACISVTAYSEALYPLLKEQLTADRFREHYRGVIKGGVLRYEVDGMAVSGVGMTGKRVPFQDRTREVIGVWSTLIPREAVPWRVTMYESRGEGQRCGSGSSASPMCAPVTRATPRA